MPDQYVIFSAEITGASANNFITFLAQQISAGTTRLVIGMNCPGGNTTAGIAIYNALLAMPYEIVMHNIGNVDSIAVPIFLAGAHRYACQTTTFMFHSVGFNLSANQRLEEQNLRSFLDTVRAEHTRISALIASRSAISVARAQRLFLNQRTRDAAWALANGVITDVRDFTIPPGTNVQIFS